MTERVMPEQSQMRSGWRSAPLPCLPPTMDRVAEPFPAFASTTTVPAFWIFSVRTFFSASVKLAGGVTYMV